MTRAGNHRGGRQVWEVGSGLSVKLAREGHGVSPPSPPEQVLSEPPSEILPSYIQHMPRDRLSTNMASTPHIMHSLFNSFIIVTRRQLLQNKFGKLCPQISQRRWLGFWHRLLEKAVGQPFPAQGRALLWTQPGYGNKVVAFNWLASILPPFSQTQTETHKAEGDLMNLPAHGLISQDEETLF